MYSRRKFIGDVAKGICFIGAGNALQSFSAKGFVLPPAADVQLRFAIASDGHYGEPNTSYNRYFDDMIGWLNQEKKQRGVDFTVINGDLFHDNPVFLPQVKQKLDGLQMKYYVSHGNHDKVDDNTWQQTWGIQQHHSFTEGNNAFLILNTADIQGKYICPDMAWTKKQLTALQDAENLFVFMHITPVKWTDNAIDCPELVELFSRQQNLKAVFHGHDHDQDAIKENGGKHYFFDAHIGGSWGTAYHGYRIVEVLNSGNILTYQMNPVTGQKVNHDKLTG